MSVPREIEDYLSNESLARPDVPTYSVPLEDEELEESDDFAFEPEMRASPSSRSSKPSNARKASSKRSKRVPRKEKDSSHLKRKTSKSQTVKSNSSPENRVGSSPENRVGSSPEGDPAKPPTNIQSPPATSSSRPPLSSIKPPIFDIPVSRPWSNAELSQLEHGLSSVQLTPQSPEYWLQVSLRVPGRSAEECENACALYGITAQTVSQPPIEPAKPAAKPTLVGVEKR